MRRPSLWKLVGLAGLAGVAATGVAVARAERRRRALGPDDIRARLHERWASLETEPPEAIAADAAPRSRLRAPLQRLHAWRLRRAQRRLRHG